mgnify:CR=1 FL=1
MAHPRRLTARFLGVPHPACQTVNEHGRGVISMYISMRIAATVVGPELHVNRALCSSARLRSIYVIHFDVKFRSQTGACFAGSCAKGRDRGRIALHALKKRV